MNTNRRINRLIDHRRRSRPGAVVPFFAILLPLFVALIVLAFDYGVIVLGRHQLQNAADAGAIAAIKAYQQGRSDADRVTSVVVGRNTLLGSPIDFDAIDSVSYGSWDAGTQTFTEIPRTTAASSGDNSGSSIPAGASAVRVRLVRSDEQGNGISLFFARFFGRDTANISVEAYASSLPSCQGFIGIDSIDIRNNARTDSYDSSMGSYNFGSNRNQNGGACSSGPVTLASGARVFGNAAGSSVTIAPGSNAMVLGTIRETPEVFNFGSINFPTSNDNNTIARGPLWAPPFYNPGTRDLIIDQGRPLTLNAGTYHFRNLLLRGGSRLGINGHVEIFVENRLVFDNGTVANLSQRPGDFILNVEQGPVEIMGGNQLHAAIFAPGADVGIANGAGFFGSIVGRTLSFAGGGGLHYDESLADDSASGSPPQLVF